MAYTSHIHWELVSHPWCIFPQCMCQLFARLLHRRYILYPQEANSYQLHHLNSLSLWLWIQFEQKMLSGDQRAGGEREWSIFPPLSPNFSTYGSLCEQHLLSKTSSIALAPTELQEHFCFTLVHQPQFDHSSLWLLVSGASISAVFPLTLLVVLQLLLH